MPSTDNRVIFACAGSGKTTRLVQESLAAVNRRIAIVTYTNNNVREILKRFGELNSGVPRHVDVMTWYRFLLQECARPYQRVKAEGKHIESVAFVNERSARGIPETRTNHFYFAGDRIYSDKLSQFVVECERLSRESVTRRLGDIYTDVFVDECQDLAGWDLEVIRLLLASSCRVTLVGDPRQHIYVTNPSPKNSQYLGVKVLDLVKQWESQGLCKIEPMNGTRRCVEAICQFVNALWPGMDAMESLVAKPDGHCGLFLVTQQKVAEYLQCIAPQVLRYSKSAKDHGGRPMNFGVSKGLEFEHVLIVPTSPISKYLATGDLKHVEKSRDKLHVAVTRARRSVGFVFDKESPIVPQVWQGNTVASISTEQSVRSGKRVPAKELESA